MDLAGARRMDEFTHGLYNNPIREIGVDREHTCKDTAAFKNPTSNSDIMSLKSPEPSGDPCGPLRPYARSVLGLHVITNGSSTIRRKREFIPEDQKDYNYWFKRKRNNEAAKRSRQRRKMEEMLLEGRAVALLRENEKLKATLSAVRYSTLGVQHAHHRSVDSFSGQSMSPYCFHPSSTDIPHTGPFMLPTAAISFGTKFRMGQDMSDSGYTDFSGLTQTPIVSSGDPCLLNKESDALQQFHRPGSVDSFSGSAVSNSYAPTPILSGYTCHGNAGIGYSFAPNAYAFDARYNTPQSTGTTERAFPVTPTSNKLPLYGAGGHRAQGTDLEESTGRMTPENPDKINPSPEGQTNRSNPEMKSNDEPRDKTAVAKSAAGIMFPLPHKLRYKVLKAIREERLGAATVDDDASGYVDGTIGKLPKGTSKSPSDAFDYTGADGLLKHQLASLYAEVKTLRNVVLTKSN